MRTSNCEPADRRTGRLQNSNCEPSDHPDRASAVCHHPANLHELRNLRTASAIRRTLRTANCGPADSAGDWHCEPANRAVRTFGRQPCELANREPAANRRTGNSVFLRNCEPANPNCCRNFSELAFRTYEPRWNREPEPANCEPTNRTTMRTSRTTNCERGMNCGPAEPLSGSVCELRTCELRTCRPNCAVRTFGPEPTNRAVRHVVPCELANSEPANRRVAEFGIRWFRYSASAPCELANCETQTANCEPLNCRRELTERRTANLRTCELANCGRLRDCEPRPAVSEHRYMPPLRTCDSEPANRRTGGPADRRSSVFSGSVFVSTMRTCELRTCEPRTGEPAVFGIRYSVFRYFGCSVALPANGAVRDSVGYLANLRTANCEPAEPQTANLRTPNPRTPAAPKVYNGHYLEMISEIAFFREKY